jgi:predicted TPR repeat methyltransferase
MTFARYSHLRNWNDKRSFVAASAYFRLGNILEKKGDSAGARAEYETTLKIDPKQKEARAALAKLKR